MISTNTQNLKANGQKADTKKGDFKKVILDDVLKLKEEHVRVEKTTDDI